jgi:hypothetical protein
MIIQALDNAKIKEDYDKLKLASSKLSKAVLAELLKGNGSAELMEAYDEWRDVFVGKPNFHPKKKHD